jgi:hypothetical protein
MVYIGSAVQNRLFATAKRHLGSGGDAIVIAAAQDAFDRTVDRLTFAEIPHLLQNVEPLARTQVGEEAAHALAAALDQLPVESDAGLNERLVAALNKSVGAAAEPLLRAACARLDLSFEAIGPDTLPDLADALHEGAVPLFGGATATQIRAAALEACGTPSGRLTAQIVALARSHLGDGGDAIIERLCREHLQVALDDLDGAGVRRLAATVRELGPDVIGAAVTASFVAEAARALTSPADGLRRQVIEVTRAVIGPLAPEFLEEVCAQRGLPFHAVDYEHLMWLAETLRAEAEPFAGRDAADNLARSVRAFLTGKR